MDKKTFGVLLKSLRSNTGLTQQDIADIINVERSAYAKYETGVIYPSLAVAYRLACIFKVSIDFLCGKRDENKKIIKLNDTLNRFSKEELIMIAQFRVLEDDQQQYIINLINGYLAEKFGEKKNETSADNEEEEEE